MKKSKSREPAKCGSSVEGCGCVESRETPGSQEKVSDPLTEPLRSYWTSMSGDKPVPSYRTNKAKGFDTFYVDPLVVRKYEGRAMSQLNRFSDARFFFGKHTTVLLSKYVGFGLNNLVEVRIAVLSAPSVRRLHFVSREPPPGEVSHEYGFMYHPGDTFDPADGTRVAKDSSNVWLMPLSLACAILTYLEEDGHPQEFRKNRERVEHSVLFGDFYTAIWASKLLRTDNRHFRDKLINMLDLYANGRESEDKA